MRFDIVSIHMYEVDAESGRKNKGFIRFGSITLTNYSSYVKAEG